MAKNMEEYKAYALAEGTHGSITYPDPERMAADRPWVADYPASNIPNAVPPMQVLPRRGLFGGPLEVVVPGFSGGLNLDKLAEEDTDETG